MEQQREQLMLKEHHLEQLARYAPKPPVYLERKKQESGKLFARWNLIVPERVLNRDWMEVT